VVALDQVFRDEWGRVLAALIGFLGDFDLAEEATQDAFAIAADRWPRDGAPASPRAWLVTTARNRAIDRIRRDRTLAEKTRLLDVPEPVEDVMDETTIPDERLELVFACCHPALELDGLELDRYHYLHAVRADLLRRLERTDEARVAYARALELVHSDPERRFLERRLAALG
jgi:predicted RNA polymerase sigma factor